MAANNNFAYILIRHGLRYLSGRIIDSIQTDASMEASCCDDLLQKILQFHDPIWAELCRVSGNSLIPFYFHNLICDETCSHLHDPAQTIPCQNCYCDLCPSILHRTFFLDYTRLPPDLVDITDSVTNGVPKGLRLVHFHYNTSAWFRVTHLMQPFWRKLSNLNNNNDI